MISFSEGKNVYAILDLRRKIKLNTGKKKKKLNSGLWKSEECLEMKEHVK